MSEPNATSSIEGANKPKRRYNNHQRRRVRIQTSNFDNLTVGPVGQDKTSVPFNNEE